MHYSRNTFTPAWLLSLILLALAPSIRADGHWDKCPQSATITLDRHVTKGSHIRRSFLRRLLPAVLVTGQTYDFVVLCPVPKGTGMDTDRDAARPLVKFYQEAAEADQSRGQIVLRPFRAPQRSVVVTPTVAGVESRSVPVSFSEQALAGVESRSVPVSFSEQALAGAHEQKIVAAVSIKDEKALVTFVLISASFYHRELSAAHIRRSRASEKE